MGSQVGFVDHKQVALGDAGAAFAWDFVTGGDVDDVESQIREFGAEGRSEVVAAAFDENDVEVGEARRQARDCFEVDGCVFADCGVWAAAGFNTYDAVRRQRVVGDEELGVFFGIDVVGDDRALIAIAQAAA